MNESALQLCLRRALEQAVAASALDEELSIHHGLSWGDFVLLEQLSQRSDGLPESELAQRLGLSRSRLLVLTRPLEKRGWVHRLEGPRRLALRPAARGLLSHATQTASDVCEQLLPARCGMPARAPA